MRRTPYLRPMSWISFWPSTLPVSAKPDGMSTAPGIFFSPHSTSALRHELGGDREHGHVDVAGHVLDALVRLETHDLVGRRVDRVDRALVAAVDQVLHHRVADLAGLARRADHRHRLGLHDAVHVAHDVFLLRPEPRPRRDSSRPRCARPPRWPRSWSRTRGSGPSPRFRGSRRPAARHSRSAWRARRGSRDRSRARPSASPPPGCRRASTARRPWTRAPGGT